MPPLGTWLRTLHWWRKVGKIEEEKNPGFEPMTSWLRGVRSTAALKLLPSRSTRNLDCLKSHLDLASDQRPKPVNLKTRPSRLPRRPTWTWPSPFLSSTFSATLSAPATASSGRGSSTRSTSKSSTALDGWVVLLRSLLEVNYFFALVHLGDQRRLCILPSSAHSALFYSTCKAKIGDMRLQK